MSVIRCRSGFPGRPDREVAWAAGQSAFEALRAGGQPIGSSCSGETVCGRCVVQVVEGGEGLTGSEADERALLISLHAEPGDRLACRLRNELEATVVVLTTQYW